MLLSREYYESNREIFKKLTCMSDDKINRLLSLDIDDFEKQKVGVCNFVNNGRYSRKLLSYMGDFDNLLLELYTFRNSIHLRLSDLYRYDNSYSFNTSNMAFDVEPFTVDFTMEDGVSIYATLRTIKGFGLCNRKMARYEFNYRVDKPCSGKYRGSTYLIILDGDNSDFVAVRNNHCRTCSACESLKQSDLGNKLDYCYNCDMSKCNAVVKGVTPVMVISIVIDAINRYISRSKEVREVWSTNNISRSISVANKSDGDVYKLLPNVEVTYVYKEPRVYEWKGGHHASPVAHKRKGHFRRCKMGNYLLLDGKFVEVPRGEGTHVKVKSCRVNWDSDRVNVNII